MGSNVKKVYLNDFDIFANYFIYFYICKVEHFINFKFLLYKLYLTILFYISPDPEQYLQTAPSSNNFPAIIGGTLGACVIVIIGVLLSLCLIRYASW